MSGSKNALGEAEQHSRKAVHLDGNIMNEPSVLHNKLRLKERKNNDCHQDVAYEAMSVRPTAIARDIFVGRGSCNVSAVDRLTVDVDRERNDWGTFLRVVRKKNRRWLACITVAAYHAHDHSGKR